jgi:hypothetical protein
VVNITQLFSGRSTSRGIITLKRDTLCDTLVLGVLCAYKDLGSHRGLVSC